MTCFSVTTQSTVAWLNKPLNSSQTPCCLLHFLVSRGLKGAYCLVLFAKQLEKQENKKQEQEKPTTTTTKPRKKQVKEQNKNNSNGFIYLFIYFI